MELTDKKQWKVSVKKCQQERTAVITIEQPLDELYNSIQILKMLSRDSKFLSTNRRKFESLSDREREVFYLLALGYSSEMIADKLCISKHTAQTHRKHLKEKLKVKSFRDIMTYARVFNFI